MSAAPSSNPNAPLWNAFRQGDRDAFEQIYSIFSQDLLNYGYRVTNNRSLIEDAIHDLFIELWQNRANLSDTDSIKFYLFRSLRNKINMVRNRDLFFQAAPLDSVSLPPDDFVIETSLIEGEELAQVYEQLRRSYALLTPRQQEALNLRFYQHFSNEEIAQIMGVNYQSACRFIYSALKNLREVVRIFSLSLLWVGLTEIF